MKVLDSALPRVIPCLLTDGKTLVKTVRFNERTYLGDPANVLSIFSEFEVDEIVLLDIDATRTRRGPNLDLVERVANECIVPLAYGGGIRSADEASRLMEIGVEKVVINTGFAQDARLVEAVSARHGTQAVTASIDARREGDTHRVFTACGTEPLQDSPAAWATRATDAGAGEILLTSIDRDGTREGFDLDLIAPVCAAVTVPVIACGGAADRADLARPIHEAGATAVAAGSIFVLYGPHRAVLVNFPSRRQVRDLLRR